MKRAQSEAQSMVLNGEIEPGKASRYAQVVRAYFSAFEKEARVHLRDVDRRLENANQVHFNLTAERGVAIKRIEATAGILVELSATEELAQ